MRTLVLAASLLLAQAAAGQVSESKSGEKSAPPPISVIDAERFAQTQIATLLKLVNKQNAKAFGFDSKPEDGDLTPGDAMPVRRVALSRLAGFTGGDALGLLGPIEQVIVPIKFKGTVQSSIVVGADASGKLKVDSFGAGGLTRLLVDGRGSWTSTPTREWPAVVHVPSLGRYYIGNLTGNTLALRTVKDEDGFPRGESVDASRLFLSLQDAAKNRRESPRPAATSDRKPASD